MRKAVIIKASAPGSTFLMGEHAVLHGQLSLVAAVDLRVNITLRTLDSTQIIIRSELGHYQGDLRALLADPRFTFILAAIENFSKDLRTGFELRVESDFSSTIGLGSSAAVTAGMVLLLESLSQQKLSPLQRFEKGLAIIHSAQAGRGSGGDLAASLLGGVVAFKTSPLQLNRIAADCQDVFFSLYYCGYKMKTPAVIEWVESAWQKNPHLLKALYGLMGEITLQAQLALQNSDFQYFGMLMNRYQGLMDCLGVNDATLSAMVYDLRGNSAVLGSKISGSGLGDCVIACARQGSIQIGAEMELECKLAQQGACILSTESS